MAEHKERLHAVLGPSSAHRWIPCPGSIRLSAGVPNYSNAHAREGTAAHQVADECLKGGYNPVDFEGEVLTVEGEEITVDEEMVAGVKVFVDYCNSLRASGTGLTWIETPISLDALQPPEDMYGYCDFAHYDPATKTLHVVDLKYGRGVVVEAKNNPQLKYYGLGAVLAVGKGLEIEHVQLTIVQPRAFHPEGVVRHDNLDYLDLLDFADDLIAAAKRTQDPDAPLHPGKHCRFCPAAGFCPAQREMVQSLAQVTFEADEPVAVTPPDPAKMSVQQLANVLDNIDVLEEFIKAAKAHGQRLLESGTVAPEALGQKLVARKSNRRWRDQGAVVTWFTKEHGGETTALFEQKMKSPAQLEKIVGKKNLPAELVEKPDNGYTMVPLSDKREGLAIAPQDVFPALPPGDE